MRRKRPARRRYKKFLWKLAFLAASLALILSASGALWAASLEIPDFGSFEERKIIQSTKIYDRTGKIVLNNVGEEIRRTVVPYSQIGRHLKNATVAIEDDEFYEHRGFKPSAFLRAILVNLTTGSFSQGGSTITQQVIKNALLTQEKTLTRKLKEIVLALKLERVLSKEKILEIYLNETPYGGPVYGVEEASLYYFGKPASDVSVAEAAYLAALPKAPSYYSPYGQHLDKLNSRKNLIIRRMSELGFISQAEAESALKETVSFLNRSDQGIKAPHFVFYVRSYLEERYGGDSIETGGLKVITSLNWELQQKAQEIVKRFAFENEKNFNASNAGVVALDPRSGEILAMIGSRDYFEDVPWSKFNVTLAHRQPGSAFKPIVYATAFSDGYTAETVVFDLPTQFAAGCDERGQPLFAGISPENCYLPTNYDEKFRGPVTFREALAQSINVPSVKVLYLTGLSDTLETARAVGITTLTDPNRYGLTLVLGGGEVKLLELTSAYGVFAADGLRFEPVSVLRVEDSAGRVLEEARSEGRRVLDENTARLISDILSDNQARAPAFGGASPLYFPGREVAAKTGTTNDYRDAWIVGFTPSFVLGAWAGNNDNTPMVKQIAGFIVAPLWHALFEEALQDLPNETFPRPEPPPVDLKPVLRGIWQGGETYFVDKASGLLATGQTPAETREERVIRSVHSILWWVDKNNPGGLKPANPAADPQFPAWEKAVREWALSAGLTDESSDVIPRASDNVHLAENEPRVKILSPQENRSYDKNERLVVDLQIRSTFPVAEAVYYLNGRFLGSSKTAPFGFSFVPAEVEGIQEQNTLSVVVFDQVRNQGQIEIVLRITI